MMGVRAPNQVQTWPHCIPAVVPWMSPSASLSLLLLCNSANVPYLVSQA